jgi:hypothetical protein
MNWTERVGRKREVGQRGAVQEVGLFGTVRTVESVEWEAAEWRPVKV